MFPRCLWPIRLPSQHTPGLNSHRCCRRAWWSPPPSAPRYCSTYPVCPPATTNELTTTFVINKILSSTRNHIHMTYHNRIFWPEAWWWSTTRCSRLPPHLSSCHPPSQLSRAPGSPQHCSSSYSREYRASLWSAEPRCSDKKHSTLQGRATLLWHFTCPG